MSKERITVMLGCNASGSHRLKPVVIGKYNNPRPFRGIDKNALPVKYYHNQKTWMSSKVSKFIRHCWIKSGLDKTISVPQIFNEWLKKFDMEMTRNKRKVLLLLDNVGSHKLIHEMKLKSVQVV